MNGCILSDLEFRDGLRLRYAMTLQNLPTHCDVCNAKCNIDHALNYKKGELVIARHNKVKDELGFLATLATSPNAVCDDPFIFPGRAANGEGNCESNSCPHVQSSTNNEGDQGDLLLRGIWERQTHCVVDVCIANVDSGSYLTSTPEKADWKGSNSFSEVTGKYDSKLLENHIFKSMWIFQSSDEHCSTPCQTQLFARISSSCKEY
eukprot:scaffold421334_cov62-Attheya_sp.AAC.3